MTPEQHAIYLTTYQTALGILAPRTGRIEEAIQQASDAAKCAVGLYPVESAPAEPAKRGPGRPPKESK